MSVLRFLSPHRSRPSSPSPSGSRAASRSSRSRGPLQPRLEINLPSYGSLFMPQADRLEDNEQRTNRSESSGQYWREIENRGELVVEIPVGMGRRRVKSIRVGLQTVLELNMGPERGIERDVIFERRVEIGPGGRSTGRGVLNKVGRQPLESDSEGLILEEGIQRFVFTLLIPQDLPGHDRHVNAKIDHRIFAELEGISAKQKSQSSSSRSRSRLPSRSGRRSSGAITPISPPYSSLSPNSDESPPITSYFDTPGTATPLEYQGQAVDPGSLNAALASMSMRPSHSEDMLSPLPGYEDATRVNKDVEWLVGTITQKRYSEVLHNIDPSGGITDLSLNLNGAVDGLGPYQFQLMSDAWTIGTLLLSTFTLHDPSPLATIYSIRVSLSQTHEIKSPRDDPATPPLPFTKSWTIFTLGTRPPAKDMNPAIDHPALWRGTKAGGKDAGELIMEGKGRNPDDNQARPTTPESVPSLLRSYDCRPTEEHDIKMHSLISLEDAHYVVLIPQIRSARPVLQLVGNDEGICPLCAKEVLPGRGPSFDDCACGMSTEYLEERMKGKGKVEPRVADGFGAQLRVKEQEVERASVACRQIRLRAYEDSTNRTYREDRAVNSRYAGQRFVRRALSVTRSYPTSSSEIRIRPHPATRTRLHLGVKSQHAWQCSPVNLYVDSSANGTIGILNNGSSPQNAFSNVHDAAAQIALTLTQWTDTSTSPQITINLAPGTYPMTTYLFLTGHHSGVPDCPVIWQSSDGEVVLSGGRAVTNWSQSSGAIWSAPVPAGSASRALFVDGISAPRARSANIFQNESIFTDLSYGYNGSAFDIADIQSPEQVDLRFVGTFTDRYMPVDFRQNDTLVMKQPAWHRNLIGYDVISQALVPDFYFGQTGMFLENSLSFLDEDGEWYLDTRTDTLYYQPINGQDPNESEIILPSIEVLLSLGGLSYDEPAHDIIFRNISFAHTTWNYPSSKFGFVDQQTGAYIGEQYERPNFESTRPFWWMTPAAVQISAAERISLEGGSITCTGAASLGIGNDDNAHLSSIGLGAKNITVSGVLFTQSGGNAIQVGGIQANGHHPYMSSMINSGINVTQNFLHDNSRIYTSATNILFTYVQYSHMTSNTVVNTTYSALNQGWGWGSNDANANPQYIQRGLYSYQPLYKTPTTPHDNLIAQNYVTNIGFNHTDEGGIYTLSVSPGTVIERNAIIKSQAQGVYLDEGSRFYLVHDNVIEAADIPWYTENTQNNDSTLTGNDTFTNNYVNSDVRLNEVLSDGSHFVGNIFFNDTGPYPEGSQTIVDAAGAPGFPRPNSN
ncbi:hypothetical protein BD324DRAFT_657582 [Kockovaella imperatae]|uniref:Right handed beta helix domain-containing protein n=1 Tax=Kockovaella imperatae TaxID=4999 RepID=A0A1Y1UDM5_9TREE|nr:hypothetical protein BD324DRAFT_657582 [Kockovaella imperatae]ORX35175.1 hypothetical protein BD324DRAFT_657582 [Kockovaella imperatae]